MDKLTLFREILRAKRTPGRLGDVAVMKAELLGYRVSPELDARLRTLPEPLPRIDTDALASLPRGTLGREYLELLASNGLEPFRLSDVIDPALVERQIFVARYSLLHDVFHVLTGFDTSWAGELGVWSFVAAQRYARGHRIAVFLASLLYPVLAPLQLARLLRNRTLGRRMGAAACSLIELPVETLWHRPVDALRRELGIVAAHDLDAQLVFAPAPT